jgi:uncharacterized membrane protein
METAMASDWWPMPFFGMFMMPVMMVVFLVVAIIIPLMRSLGMGPPWSHGHDSPLLQRQKSALDLLNQRLARGEIESAAYEERRRMIAQG